MKTPYIIAIVVILAAVGVGVYLSRTPKTNPDTASMPANNMASNKQSTDDLKPVDQVSVSGSEDQIINDVVASFNDEAKIESQGDADVAVVSQGDDQINSLMLEYNENAF